MLFRLYLIRQDGWRLPRFRSCMQARIVGHLQISDEHDPGLNRAARTARMIDADTCAPIADIKPLRDVQIIAASRTGLTLSGTETIEDEITRRVRDVAQSWLLEAADPEK